jgi:hypothetical protein
MKKEVIFFANKYAENAYLFLCGQKQGILKLKNIPFFLSINMQKMHIYL